MAGRREAQIPRSVVSLLGVWLLWGRGLVGRWGKGRKREEGRRQEEERRQALVALEAAKWLVAA